MEQACFEPAKDPVWRLPVRAWAALTCALLVACWLAFDGLQYMVRLWGSKDEYSHAYFLPLITALLVWQKRDALDPLRFDGSWLGFACVVAGAALFFVGEFSTLYVIIQYSFVLIVVSLMLTFMGWRAFRKVWVALLLLVFMIPLPDFIYRGLSAELQLLSSQIGVAIIRLFGISVFLEGNVIDLGTYQLQVAEACNGLRYLFPLTALGFIAAYLFRGTLWQRALIFLSTIPITILMNSFRIGVIGVMVEHRGIRMAEGFLHDFEGWAIFMACTAVLVGEMALLARLQPGKRSLREAFSLELPPRWQKGTPRYDRSIPAPFLFATLFLVFATAVAVVVPSRQETIPPRRDFAHFPLTVGEWYGKSQRLDDLYVNVLKFDDYLAVDFLDPMRNRVNFYVAYYGSQRKGESVHSPASCIPGGGWEIAQLSERALGGVMMGGKPLRVNRVLIQKGDEKQLVYYWFQQRERVITSEYLVKWYLFWDALTRNRTDGALIRMVTPVAYGQTPEEADARLTHFAKTAVVELERYLPD